MGKIINADKTSDNPQKISKTSVANAILMVRRAIRKKDQENKSKQKKINKNTKNEEHNCLINLDNSRKSSNSDKIKLTGYNVKMIIQQMRLAILKHDWKTVQILFLYIEKNKSMFYAFEPILWRTVFLIFLNSPMSNCSYFEEFLRKSKIIDNIYNNPNNILKQIMTLETY
ncbi:hypothetical protein HCN44_006036 [Aphidius gifuensis]|uniref:Uncharacterized protein n=1 Tax=Aphidius gifuensis TaxID=684658 RepID=A0A834Y3N4_APHGI|nr:uncharacterized protein LOC122851282 [Aphidius gifuensis]KAF7997465.1 hypothetical protein HCN44_006036 [Aphidius gifuensis]